MLGCNGKSLRNSNAVEKAGYFTADVILAAWGSLQYSRWKSSASSTPRDGKGDVGVSEEFPKALGSLKGW